jgi:hypothetical protein
VIGVNRDDELLVRSLLEPLDRVEGVRRRTGQAPRPKRAVALLALVAFAVVGVAVAAAADWGPVSGIASVDHPATSGDGLGRDVLEQLRSDELPAGSGAVDQIGKRIESSARLVGTLPDGRRLYVVASSNGKLCVVAALLAESCSDRLTPDAPITFTIVRNGLGSRPLAYGVAMDGVVSVSFSVGGTSVTLPVRNNAFAYEGDPYRGPASHAGPSFSAPSVTFADGRTLRAYREPTASERTSRYRKAKRRTSADR